MKTAAIIIFMLLIICNRCFAGNLDRLFYALSTVESHNRPLAKHKDVNGVVVIGYFQISKAYWTDAHKYDPSIGGSWERCQWDYDYCTQVLLAYTKKYHHNKYKDPETISRCLNGGPDGDGSISTIKYWNKVKKVIKEEE